MHLRWRPFASCLLTLALAAAALGVSAPQLALASPQIYIVNRTDDVIATAEHNVRLL